MSGRMSQAQVSQQWMSKLAFLLLLVLVVACVSVADEGGMGTLAGTVVGSNGRPIVGAHVTSQEAGGSHPGFTTTNAQGRFFFPELTRGYYDVRAYAKGSWSEWKHNIEVKTGKQTDVTLRIPQKKQAS
jgi:Carboxypeptidase regulatory-like domain